MAKKKSVRKTTKARKPVKRATKAKAVSKRRAPKKTVVHHRVSPSRRRFQLTEQKWRVVKQSLLIYVILGVLSYVIYSVAANEIIRNFFLFLTIIFGFLVLTFLIVFISFYFMEYSNSKKRR